jgi:large conductance mechanosensitive channel
MSVIQEFKKFALRGNAIDMAVGIIIGGAFTSVVKSLVDDVLMPPIGALTGGVDFKWIVVKIPILGRDPVNVNVGNFINNVITFVIVAWAAFLLVKAINTAETRLMRGETPPAETPPPPEDILLLREIRDTLQRSR